MIRRRKPLGLVAGVLPIILLACGGCGLFSLPTDIAGIVLGAEPTDGTRIVADVTTTDANTGLPTHLTGSVSGDYDGTYDEEILEFYFDDDGMPIGALSRSVFVLTGPDAGIITSLNLITVVDLVFATDTSGAPLLDDEGAPMVIGLETAASGQIITGAGAYQGVAGELHTDSTFMLVGGAANLGTIDSGFTLTLAGDQAGNGNK